MAGGRVRPIILTQGDPAGIGIELTLKCWLERDARHIPAFAVVGDVAHFERVARSLSWDVPCETLTDAAEAPGLFQRALPIIPLHNPVQAQLGKPDSASAKATIESIERAVHLVQAGHGSAVVTNPIAKHVLYDAGFSHPGHTEFLAALAASPDGAIPHPVMMIWSETLAVVPITVHIPLAKVPASLTPDLIAETGRIVAKDLHDRFGIAHPRLAFAGLNPHAGENGTMGAEDRTIIAPAIELLRSEGIDATGPLPADTMFHARARQHYDAALAMYHDQALIPIKTIAFDEGVNVTLGLPFIRTSPDHGTAFDIAGKGVARPDSLMAAIKLAARLSERSIRP